jgi:hypothetical protein
MTLSCPRIVVSRTRESFGEPLELPPDFAPDEVRIVLLRTLDELVARPDAIPSTGVTLSVLRLPGVSDIWGVEDGVAAAVVSEPDFAVGWQAIVSTETISVVGIATLLIFGSRD